MFAVSCEEQNMKQNVYNYQKTKRRSKLTIALVICLMIAVAAFAVIVIGIMRRETKAHSEPVTEYTTGESQYEVASYVDGKIPYYENVEKNKYSAEAFSLNEATGRISYLDSSVPTETGIDVSSYQDDIDWEQVAADGIDFAIIRAGFRGYGNSGTLNTDDRFIENIEACKANGIKVGVYFYSQAISVAEAVEEADYTLSIVNGYKLDYPIVFDWENESDVEMRTDNVRAADLTSFATAFCDRIVSKGYKTAVYMNLENAYVKYDLGNLPNYPLWFASTGDAVPEMYYHFAIWQYTHKGTVAGIGSGVDINIAFVNELV